MNDFEAARFVRRCQAEGRLRDLRIQACVTQSEAASLAEISRRTLGRWEAKESRPRGTQAARYGRLLLTWLAMDGKAA